ncbi:MAG: hypothetical protein RLZZ66_456 [Pseudomonadota bacterium]|jgi:hypothetical protein
MKKITLIVFLTLFSSNTFAEYHAEGEIVGYVSNSLAKFFPSLVKNEQKIVHSVRQKDGKVYKMRRIFQDAEVQLNGQGECIVHPEHEPILLGITPEGLYEELHVKYLKFLCVKM